MTSRTNQENQEKAVCFPFLRKFPTSIFVWIRNRVATYFLNSVGEKTRCLALWLKCNEKKTPEEQTGAWVQGDGMYKLSDQQSQIHRCSVWCYGRKEKATHLYSWVDRLNILQNVFNDSRSKQNIKHQSFQCHFGSNRANGSPASTNEYV